MNKINKNLVEKYLRSNARPIDIAVYEHAFNNGSTDAVISELKTFQNNDGGFGNAIEPDLRLPQSTALATWMAFQFIKETKVNSEHEVVQKALKYFVNTYNKNRNGWAIVRPEVDEYPHSPWWEYKTAMEHFSWGNPSAEILGLLIKYKVEGIDEIIDTLKKVALQRVQEVDPKDFHDVFNFKALYTLADVDFKKQLQQPVENLINKAASKDPDEWKNYVATPLKFIESPDDPFAQIFDQDLIQKNLNFIPSKIIDNNHWEPNWDWAGTYPDDWEVAKKEWSGHLTVKNMITLKNFCAL